MNTVAIKIPQPEAVLLIHSIDSVNQKHGAGSVTFSWLRREDHCYFVVRALNPLHIFFLGMLFEYSRTDSKAPDLKEGGIE